MSELSEDAKAASFMPKMWDLPVVRGIIGSVKSTSTSGLVRNICPLANCAKNSLECYFDREKYLYLFARYQNVAYSDERT